MDVIEAWKRIGAFMGMSSTGAVAPVASIPVPSASTTPASEPRRPLSLTKEQAEEARRLAREEKARRLKLSLREVNLTPKEAKDAKAAMRKKLEAGERVITPSPVKAEKVEAIAPANPSPPVSAPPKNGESVQERKISNPERSVDSPKSGLRATALTKLKGCRKMCLQTTPLALNEPKVLHLIAYHNHFNRLVQQWDSFQQSFELYGLRNPLRDLVNPSRFPKVKSFIEATASECGLREQVSSPGTYILQVEGRSYWDRDMPSADCPRALSQDLPEWVLSIFRENLGAAN